MKLNSTLSPSEGQSRLSPRLGDYSHFFPREGQAFVTICDWGEREEGRRAEGGMYLRNVTSAGLESFKECYATNSNR